ASNVGLKILKREQKGSGSWQELLFQGPEGHESLLFPKLTSGGINFQNMYMLALTAPYENGGSIYHYLDGALLYSRSTDAGQTWDIENQILPGTDSSECSGFTHDCYAFAPPHQEIVAFVAGSYEHDFFLMKSTDAGTTFEKTLIWDHPYNEVNPIGTTDTFYCPDGSLSAAIDLSGIVHVVFGIMRTRFDGENWIFYKLTNGIGYWNETMNSFSSNKNALHPNGHPDSELIKDVNLIGYEQDLDGDGLVTYINEPSFIYEYYYSMGLSSMPQLHIDDLNHMFLTYSMFTETYHNGYMNYRRLWLRSSFDGGQTWRPFYHYIPDNPEHIYWEFAYPSIAPESDEYLYVLYNHDFTPGIYRIEWPPHHNFFSVVKIPKEDVVGMHNLSMNTPAFSVEQNFPNPF
ncbi:MAG: exo-alpha-sialidase, partial [Bacteroidales bacterium]|nr:exo-alpha-sialidase [Bacteroidales bacterium]